MTEKKIFNVISHNFKFYRMDTWSQSDQINSFIFDYKFVYQEPAEHAR